MSHVRKILGQLALVVAGSLATVLIMGGGPAGAFSVPNNSVNSAKIVNNTVSSADIKDGTVAPADLSNTARARWAKVSGGTSGTLIRGRGVTSASRYNPGNYVVTFAQPITGCGWTATLNDNDAGSVTTGQIAVERHDTGDPYTLRVRTYDSLGTNADTPANDGFTVVVHC